MAKAKHTGSLSVNLTGLTFRECDSFEVAGRVIIVTNYEGDTPVETIRLHAAQTICGIDAKGAWYAHVGERVEHLENVDSVEVATTGDLVVKSGEDAFVYIPSDMAGRAVITGDVQVNEAEDEIEEEPEEETVQEAPPRRTRRTNAQIAEDEAAAAALTAAAAPAHRRAR
jgi:hypothetical protein